MNPTRRTATQIAVLLLTVAIFVGCDSSSDSDDPSGSLSGIVREEGTQTPLPNISVELGSVETTSDQNGHYTFSELPVGQSMALRASANGFELFSANVVLQAGSNSRDIVMVRKTYYTYDFEKGDFGLYLPPGIATYRGAIFWVGPPQEESDTRGFASGNPTSSVPAINAHVAALRVLALQLADEHGLALMGALIVNEEPFSALSFDNVLKALEQAADESGRSELAQVPLLIMGHSRGGCYSYAFTRARSERTIGFMSSKGNCHIEGDAGAAKSVPGYLFIGATDEESRRDNITDVFETNRSTGALWALATEPGAGHTPVNDYDLLGNWMDAVIAGRLPATGGSVTLRSIDEATGWLGDRESRSIAEYAAYEGDRLQASWLPSMLTAEDWEAFVSAVPSL
ncbi:MAG TPA: carboxypeptidase-like regulatory domain-containing protein [Rhodothermales bacterium]|nr:carboxypeptidase-like regulatory domain-containing protein [Rhodothermales bacterium]